jgi:AraC-like DNA-binding protein
MTEATTLASWARAMRRALDAAGVDSAALFAQAGLNAEALADPQARYSTAATARLWQLSVAATKDPTFGLSAARHSSQGSFHALGYALAASSTLADAFARLMRYFRIVTDVADLQVQPGPVEWQVSVLPSAQAVPEAIDAFVFNILRMCRMLRGRDYAPLRVELMRPAAGVELAYQRAFRAPVVFSAGANILFLDAASMQLPLEDANAELAQHNDEIAARYLATIANGSVVDRVRKVLIDMLRSGEPHQQELARRMHLSIRTLQRQLAEAGSSYSTLLDDTRRQLALAYLANAQYDVSEIAFLLGYTDAGSFTHAFRRWTGTSPSAWRATGQKGSVPV